MSSELSSNWKKLQAKIKAEGSTPATKRRATEIDDGKEESRPPKKKSRTHPEKLSGKPSTARSQEAQPQAGQSGQTMMGEAQSKLSEESTTGVSPSLALWAADNDISIEDVAQAYGIGVHSKSLVLSSESRPNEGLAADVEVGKYIAMDCEMVGVGEGGYDSALARVSIIDFHGRQVYDSFVRQRQPVVDWRTPVSGVSPKNMRTARRFDEVQLQVADLLKGRILVGHDLKHDLQVLELDHPLKLIRDTARFSGFKKYGHGRKPALRVLAQEILGLEIQKGPHSSIEDARVAMLLFRKHKPAVDVEHASRFPDTLAQQPNAKTGPGPQKQKKKKRKKRKN